MSWVLLALGLVLCVEGLVLALAPTRIEEVLQFLRTLPPDRLRSIGLGALAAGVVLIWLAHRLGPVTL